jgi:7,8-dihydropterin-6-yl-methyl-4-(beta-D-ribofuranosyl)aminobenzene 5'-phosphate synthase
MHDVVIGDLKELKSVKITTLADNCVYESGFVSQWGLSFLIEAEDHRGRIRKIIFDTGAIKESLLYNIRRLKIDLSNLEYIVLSHGHSDHTAATVELLKMAKSEVRVITHPHVFLPKFAIGKDGKRVEGGPPKGQRLGAIRKAGGRLIQTTKPFELFPGAYATGEIPRVTDFERISPPVSDATAKRLTVVEGKTVPDLLLDDQGLLMNVKRLGLVVITGCSHAGVVNTLLHAQRVSRSKNIYGAIGGFHLVQRDDSYIQKTVRQLRNLRLQLISPSHCTGFKASCALYHAFPEAFVLNFSGRTMEVGRKPRPQTV